MKWSFGTYNDYGNIASNWTRDSYCKAFSTTRFSDYSPVDTTRTRFSTSESTITYPANYVQSIYNTKLYSELNSFFKVMGVNAFFCGEFTDPRNMPIYYIVYQYNDSSVSSAAVRNAYIAAGRDFGTGFTYISFSTLDAFLKKYTGYGINDANWDFKRCDYIKSLDVFSIQHGDTNYRPEIYYRDGDITVQNIYVNGNAITVVFSVGDVVTLKKLGNGNYQFVSHILPKDYDNPEWANEHSKKY